MRFFPNEPFDPRRIEVIDKMSAEIMSRMSGVKRIQMGCGLGDWMREAVRMNLKRQHPEWSEDQLRREMLRRMGHERSI